MHLSSLERYEIQAEAFRRMTGHLAPGKDAAAGTYDEAANRTEIYARWAELHGECVYAVLDAVDYVLRTAEDDEADDVVALDAAQRDAERSAERDAEMRADAFGEKP
ncbi:MAG: hypothetical protein IPI16_17465 [Comamonadaceae bacterium]|jgi:hypothetical protein|nr:hypothetical protein [Comamonadaceae bacterium]